MKGRIYLNYANDGAWVLTWKAAGDGRNCRLTFDTEGEAHEKVCDHGIKV